MIPLALPPSAGQPAALYVAGSEYAKTSRVVDGVG